MRMKGTLEREKKQNKNKDKQNPDTLPCSLSTKKKPQKTMWSHQQIHTDVCFRKHYCLLRISVTGLETLQKFYT